MRNATLLILGALALTATASAQCTGTEGTDFQRVTIDEITAVPQENIDALNAAGEDLDLADAQELLANDLVGETVEVTAVVMTNPLLSGVRSLNAETGIPNSVQIFIRDVAAATEGPEGMGLLVNDEETGGTVRQFFVGDEVVFCGVVDPYTAGGAYALQIELISANGTGNAYGPEDDLLQPITITPADIHDAYGTGTDAQSQLDWSVYSDYVNQYVRFEAIELVQGIPASGGRPNMLFSAPGEDETIRSDDISVCYRNDRGVSYFPGGDVPACVADGDFVPPATGIVNVQGFLSFRGTFDTFSSTVPQGAAFAISPFEADDFVIAAAPPVISVERVLLTTDGTVRASVIPGTEGNTVSSVTVSYSTASGASGEIELTNTSGDVYEGSIPNLVEGDFVTYSFTSVDNQNLSTPLTTPVTSLVVDGAITDIFQVQATPGGGPGESPLLTDDPVAFDLDAVVQTAYQAGSRFQATIQDDPDLGPFSGVLLDFGSDDPGLAVGDQITISEARVSEFRDVTQLVDVTFTTTGSGDPYPAKVVTTDLFNGTDGDATGEQHEGMLLRFEDAVVTSTNPDAGQGTGCTNDDCGEWAFSSDATEANQLRADDAANEFPSDFNSTLSVGQAITIEGYLSYSFGNYKLIPTEASDVVLGSISVEGDLETSSLWIVGSYPNPAGRTARVAFELATAADVSLRVFDAMGREVAVVAEGARAAGAHSVTADLGGLASGVYVLRLDAAGEVATARIAVVR